MAGGGLGWENGSRAVNDSEQDGWRVVSGACPMCIRLWRAWMGRAGQGRAGVRAGGSTVCSAFLGRVRAARSSGAPPTVVSGWAGQGKSGYKGLVDAESGIDPRAHTLTTGCWAGLSRGEATGRAGGRPGASAAEQSPHRPAGHQRRHSVGDARQPAALQGQPQHLCRGSPQYHPDLLTWHCV